MVKKCKNSGCTYNNVHNRNSSQYLSLKIYIFMVKERYLAATLPVWGIGSSGMD